MNSASSRVGTLATVALHGAALAALLSYEPARTAILAAAPIMVEWISAPNLEASPQPPRPKPIPRRHVTRPVEPPPVLAEEPSASLTMNVPSVPRAPLPPEPLAAAPAPAPLAVTAPVFNADYLQNPRPAYPPLSRRMGEQGKVLLRVLVNALGNAEEIELRASSGYARLDDTARDTVKRWKFVPAKRGAESVPAWVLIPISFRLEG